MEAFAVQAISALMRLIDTTTGEFRSFNGPLDVPYAILSHTWFLDGEQSYQDILAIQESFRAQRNVIAETLYLADKPPGISHVALRVGAWTWDMILDSISALLFLATHLRHTPPSVLSRVYVNILTILLVSLVHPWEPYTALVLPTLRDSFDADETSVAGDTTHFQHPSISASSILSSPLVCMKLSDACARAREDGYELLWVDSCCIDKSSSAELSEAINSMFEWYSRASICYVYLADVDDDDIVDDPHSQFRRARWHNRGWTLQELIAPRYVVFFSRNWRPLGTKSTLSRVIEAVTGVDRAILNQDRPVHSASVARRMSWAAKRETTRVEDQAYSLLGIFGLHLATNYGEGRNAFVRLQEAILRAIPDQSIFAWGHSCAESLPSVSHLQFLLAPSPAAFASADQVKPLSHEQVAARLRASSRLPLPEYLTTSYGIRTRFPMIPLIGSHLSFFFGSGTYAICAPLDQPVTFTPTHFAILECEDSFGRLVALPLSCANSDENGLTGSESKVEVGWIRVGDTGPLTPFRTVSLSPADLKIVNAPIHLLDVLIRGQPLLEDDVSFVESLSPWSVRTDNSLLSRRIIGLCDWSRNLLIGQGFTVTHMPRLEGMSGILNGTFPRKGLFHRKDDVFLLSSSKEREHILVRLGRNPEAMDVAVYCAHHPRLDVWEAVNGQRRIHALRVEAVNVAWTTFELPTGSNMERHRTLRLSLHNLTRSLRQYGAIREYHFELSIELCYERTSRHSSRKVPVAQSGGHEENNRGQDFEDDGIY